MVFTNFLKNNMKVQKTIFKPSKYLKKVLLKNNCLYILTAHDEHGSQTKKTQNSLIHDSNFTPRVAVKLKIFCSLLRFRIFLYTAWR